MITQCLYAPWVGPNLDPILDSDVILDWGWISSYSLKFLQPSGTVAGLGPTGARRTGNSPADSPTSLNRCWASHRPWPASSHASKDAHWIVAGDSETTTGNKRTKDWIYVSRASLTLTLVIVTGRGAHVFARPSVHGKMLSIILCAPWLIYAGHRRPLDKACTSVLAAHARGTFL